MPQHPVQKFQVGVDIPVKRNVIINGSLDIWQRGTSFSAIANNAYSADRWLYGKIGAMVHTVSRSTDVPTVAQAGRLFNFSFQLALTTPDNSIAAGDETGFSQRVEGFNFAPLAQQPMVLSFWVRAGIAGVYCVSFTNTIASDRSYVAEYTINSLNTWEYKTIQIAASPSAGTWDYQSGIGLRVRWAIAAGTNFHTTPNVWQTGNFLATANQVNGAATGAGNFRITGAQLEPGTIATPFEVRPISEELALCQRYYEKSYNVDVNQGTITNAGAITGEADGVRQSNLHRPFAVVKRITPMITWYNPLTGASGSIEGDGAPEAIVGTGFTGTGNVGIPQTVNNLAATVDLVAHFTADAEL